MSLEKRRKGGNNIIMVRIPARMGIQNPSSCRWLSPTQMETMAAKIRHEARRAERRNKDQRPKFFNGNGKREIILSYFVAFVAKSLHGFSPYCPPLFYVQ
jgi:hypothetical protein